MVFSFYIISRAPLELKKQAKQEKKNTIIKFIVNQVKNCKQIIQSDDFLQYLIYLIISGFGIFKNTYYFSLHLFYLFGRLELLKSVF
jgi:inositol 1,4,5-triphosphate receptor type 1/inositol 1,4,5-triphosphate receptor type 3